MAFTLVVAISVVEVTGEVAADAADNKGGPAIL